MKDVNDNQATETKETRPEFEDFLARVDRLAAGSQAMWRFPHRSQTMGLEHLVLQSVACADLLAGLGVRKTDRVALVLTAGAEFVVALLALWRLGAVAVPLRDRGGKGFDYMQHMQRVDEVCDLRGVIADDGSARQALEHWTAGARKPVWAARDLTRSTQSTAYTPAVTLSKQDIAVLQLTSGTTSAPKAVVVTHGMVSTQLAYLADSHRYYGGGAISSMGSWLPLNHDMGLFTAVLLPLYEGCDNLVATPTYYMRNPKRWFELLSEQRVQINFATNSSAVAACRALARAGTKPRLDLSALHLSFGAEKLQRGVLEQFERTLAPLGLSAARIHVGYGSSEATLTATRTPPGPVNRLTVAIDAAGRVRIADDATKGRQETKDLVSVGKALPGVRLTVHDRKGRVLPDLRVGEVCLAGPCITQGYFRDRKNTARAVPGRVLRTRDLGFLYRGELYYLSRKDDLVIVGGRNLVPDDLEQAVEDLPYVGPGRTVLLGVEYAGGATRPVLLVEVGNVDRAANDAGWEAGIRLRLAGFDLATAQVIPTPKGTVEKTTAGKKRRQVVLQRLLNGEIGGVSGRLW